MDRSRRDNGPRKKNQRSKCVVGVFNRASSFVRRVRFRTLDNYVSLGEIRDVIHVLPEEILTPWPPLQLPMWSSEAPLSNRQTECQAQGNPPSDTRADS
jgi:hypothetical protein